MEFLHMGATHLQVLPQGISTKHMGLLRLVSTHLTILGMMNYLHPYLILSCSHVKLYLTFFLMLSCT